MTRVKTLTAIIILAGIVIILVIGDVTRRVLDWALGWIPGDRPGYYEE